MLDVVAQRGLHVLEFLDGGAVHVGEFAGLRDDALTELVRQHQGAIHEVAQDGHQLVVVAGLEVLPGEVVVLGLGSIGREHIAQHVLLAGEVHQVFMQPHSPVAAGGNLVALQVQELVGRHVVGHHIVAMGLHHRGEDDAVEHDVVLADEVDEARVLLLPPLLPRAPAVGLGIAQFLGVADVADGRVKPHVEHLALGTLDGHGDAPVQVARHGAGLQPVVEPRLALAIDVAAPFLMALEDPLLEPALILVEGQEPVGGVLEHEGMVAVLGVRVDEFGGVQVTATAVLTLVALGCRVVAVGALALDVAVGQELAVLLVIELLGHLLDELALVIEFAEELSGKLVMRLARRAAVDIIRDTQFLERIPDDGMVTVHDLLRSDALLAGSLGHGHTMLIAAAHKQHILALQSQVAHIDVGGHIHTGQVTDVDRSVSIGQRRRHQRACKFLLFLHLAYILLFSLLLFSLLACKGTKKFLESRKNSRLKSFVQLPP